MISSSNNKKVIIIGATSGIGKELALLYVQAGYRVAVTGRRAALLEELRLRYPGQVVTACFDVQGNDNLRHVQSLIDQLGGLDLLLYNSGTGKLSKTLNPEIERVTYETNVKGFIEIIPFAFNFFVEQGHGHIAATSSIASIRGNSLVPAYSASKAFMSVYMESLYMKATRMKLPVSITDIRPGFVRTNMAEGPGLFWVASPVKAAKQIFRGIQKRKWRIYITHRWWLIAQLMKWMPDWLYHKIG